MDGKLQKKKKERNGKNKEATNHRAVGPGHHNTDQRKEKDAREASREAINPATVKQSTGMKRMWKRRAVK